MESIRENLGKVSVTVEKDNWDISKEYPRLTIVSNNQTVYISRKDVPANIDITNEEYWKLLVSNSSSCDIPDNIATEEYVDEVVNDALQKLVIPEDKVYKIIKDGNIQDSIDAFNDGKLCYYIDDDNIVFIANSFDGSYITCQGNISAETISTDSIITKTICIKQYTPGIVNLLGSDSNISLKIGKAWDISEDVDVPAYSLLIEFRQLVLRQVSDIWTSIRNCQTDISNIQNDISGINTSIEDLTQTVQSIGQFDDSNCVHKSGAETINGDKTFTKAVVVGTPTSNNHATTKQYVDDNITTLNNSINIINSNIDNINNAINNIEEFDDSNCVHKTGDETINGKKTFAEIIVPAPTQNNHAVNKQYVDNIANGISIPSLDGYATEQWVEEQNYLTETDIPDVYTKTEIDNKLASVFHYQATIQTWDDLPTTNISVGDVYNIVETSEHNKAGDNVAWTGTEWDVLAGVIDLSAYALSSDTLEGYGIIDAYIQNGTITIGSNSITPLTQHQSLGGYATEQYVDDAIHNMDIPSLDGYATEQWVTNQNYLVQSDLSGYALLGDSLEDYNILDAFIEDGTIYLGRNSITPLTEHQSLDGYATEDYVNNQIENSLTNITADYSIYFNKAPVTITPSTNGNPDNAFIRLVDSVPLYVCEITNDVTFVHPKLASDKSCAKIMLQIDKLQSCNINFAPASGNDVIWDNNEAVTFKEYNTVYLLDCYTFNYGITWILKLNLKYTYTAEDTNAS